MRIFGGLTDCECACTLTERPSEGGPKSPTKEDLVAGQCCAGELDDCCTEKEDEPETKSGQ